MRKWMQHVAHILSFNFFLKLLFSYGETDCSIKFSVSMISIKISARSNKVVCNIVGILFYGQGILSDISTIVLL